MSKPLKTSRLAIALILLLTVCVAIVFAILVFVMTMREYRNNVNNSRVETTHAVPDTLNVDYEN